MKHATPILLLATLALGLSFGSDRASARPLRLLEHQGLEKENVLEVGKKGVVTFRTQVKVGGLSLLPGRYLVQHHTEGSEHYVRFRLLNRVRHDPFSSQGGKERCTLEPLEGNVSETVAVLSEEDEVPRLRELRIMGENVAHVF